MAASNSATRPSPRGGRLVALLVAMRPTLTDGLSRPLGPRWSASPTCRARHVPPCPCVRRASGRRALGRSGEQLAIRIVPSYGRQRHRSRRRTPPMERNWRDLMRALIAGGGMAGLMTALALRESGVFTTIDVFEQTRPPSTAGAGLNNPPNGARPAKGLGGDPHGGGPQGTPRP